MRRRLAWLGLLGVATVAVWMATRREPAVEHAAGKPESAIAHAALDAEVLATPDFAAQPEREERAPAGGGAVLAGRVVWSSGGAAPFASLVVRSESDSSFARELQVDGFGAFQLVVPDRGPFRIAAERTRRVDGEHDPVACRGLASGVRAPARELRIELAAEHEVRGRVLGPGGEPPAAFHVVASRPAFADADWESVQQEFIGHAGRFALMLPSGGAWDVHASAPCLVDSSALTVEVRGIVEDVVLACGATATIRGHVVDPEGRPIPGARVEGGRQTITLGLFALHRERTDSRGAFLLGCLDPGAQRVWAACDGYAPSGAIDLDLAPGESRDGVVLELRRGARVDARVTFGHPSASRRVSAALVDRETRRRLAHRISARTPRPSDADVSLSELPSGSFDFVVEIRDELGERRVGAPVELVEGGAVALELHDAALPRVSVAGRLTAGGDPLVGWPIRFESEGSAHVVETSSSIGGRYETRLPHAGAWNVSTRRREITFATTVDVPDVESWTCDLEFGGGSIAGHVRGPHGPAKSCLLRLSSESGAVEVDATRSVGPDGAFEFELVPPGTYRIDCFDSEFGFDTAATWLAIPLEHVVVGPGERVEGLELSVVQAARVTVELRGADPGSMTGFAEAIGRERSLETASFGSRERRATARFDHLPAGELRVFAACGERCAMSGWFSIDAGEVREIELELQPAARVDVWFDPGASILQVEDAFLAAPGSSEGERAGWQYSPRGYDGEKFGARLVVMPGDWELVVVLVDGRRVRRGFTARVGEPARLVVPLE